MPTSFTNNASIGIAIPVTIGNTSTLIWAGNLSAIGASIVNNGSETVYVSLGVAATMGTYMQAIPPSGYYEVPYNWIGPIFGIAETGSSVVMTAYFPAGYDGTA